MNREKLKRIVQDIEATEKAIADLSAHKREVYSNNKDEFDPKVLRKIIARRKMDPDSRTRDDDLLDQYENALGMTGKLAAEAASGERTYEEAAEAAGVSRRTMARQIARAKTVPKPTDNGTQEPDSEVETLGDVPAVRSEPSHPAEKSVNAAPPLGQTVESSTAKGDKPAPITETAPDTPPSPAPEFGVGPGTNPAPRYSSSSAEQPVSNAADVPTREDGRAGERDPDSQTPEIAQPAGVKANNDGILGTDSLSRPATPQDTWDDIVRDHPTFLRRSA